MKRVLFYIIISVFLLCNKTYTQDVHFSQITMVQSLLNPALTGVYNGTHRATVNHKSQWRGMGMPGATYNTTMIAYDGGLFKSKLKRGYLGAGVNAYRDVSGALKMGTIQINLSTSGIVYISKNQMISAGIMGGFVQKSIASDGIQSDSQYDESTGKFNASLPSNDISSIPPNNSGDFSAGLSWNYSNSESSMLSNNMLKISLGAAWQHVNRPKQKFNLNDNFEQLYSKQVVHGSAQIGIGQTNYSISPSAIVYKQGPSYEAYFGAFVRFTLQEGSKYTKLLNETALSLGGYYRNADAFVPAVFLEYSNFTVGVSYDLTVSALKTSVQGMGGLELSLRYTNPNPFRTSASSVRFL